ncbi:MAG TPA: hypothetical protein PKY35_15070 [Candidatus Hydrogenedentes bacterium]|nr:hypothetical protein [Candidatus Hydrogenedentota bacterium]HOL78336.1 hypothetical protein [Candidatus Hydrogenedentota bacterium]HPO86303.1 hypothetical protein [Candidatus Hydrogenedentota bacterium]
MSEFKIGVFCNGGTHVTEVLAAARQKYPHANLCAILPPSFELTPNRADGVDRIVRTDRDNYTVRDVKAGIRLIRQIRKERFDLFVVLFDSMQLNVLGGLSGARSVECWDNANVIHRLPRSPEGVVRRLLVRRLKGFMRWCFLELLMWVTQKKGPDLRRKEDSFMESSFLEDDPSKY